MYGEQIYRGVIVNHNEINHVLVCYLLLYVIVRPSHGTCQHI